VAAAVQPQPATSKINWQEGLSMGRPAAQGLNKIVKVLEGQPVSVSPLQQQQQSEQQAQRQQNALTAQILQNVQAYQNAQVAQNSTFGYLPNADANNANGNTDANAGSMFDLNIQASLPDYSSIQANLPDFSNIQSGLANFSNIWQPNLPDFGTTMQEMVVSETVYDGASGDTTTVTGSSMQVPGPITNVLSLHTPIPEVDHHGDTLRADEVPPKTDSTLIMELRRKSSSDSFVPAVSVAHFRCSSRSGHVE
jgi:hypothetical protein